MLTNSVRTPCKARDFCLVRNSQWRYSNVVVGGKIRENCFLGTLTKTILNSIIVVFSLLIHEVLLQFAELWGQQKRRQKGTFWKMLIFHKKSWTNVAHLTLLAIGNMESCRHSSSSQVTRHNHAKWDTYVEHHFSVMNAFLLCRFPLFNAFSCMIIVRTSASEQNG